MVDKVMNCYVATGLGLALLGGSLGTQSVTKEEMSRLDGVLSEENKKLYRRVVYERSSHYIYGLLLGLLAAYSLSGHYEYYGVFHRMMAFVGTTLLVCLAYYSLMPKSYYMMDSLKTSEETRAWFEVYKRMKRRYAIGSLMGLAAAVPLSWALCGK